MQDYRDLMQKTVRVCKSGNMWLLGNSGSDGYLASQCKGKSGIDRDINGGWKVIGFWEDKYQIIFLLQHDGMLYNGNTDNEWGKY